MTAKSSEITACRTVVEFFKTEVERALRTQNLETSEEVNFYLVRLLQMFTKADEVDVSLDESLALLLHRAVFAQPRARIAAYRQLGDLSLYVAGLFSPSLRRRRVDVDYAISMGAGAYATVAVLTRRKGTRSASRTVPLLYLEMSEKFPDLVEVLMQISENNGFGCDAPDLAALYERFSRTKGPHLLRRLRRHGVWPGTLALATPTSVADKDEEGDDDEPLIRLN